MSAKSTHQRATNLYRFSWAIVLYTVVVIAWGAWVRISGSGDGCGDHWPLCHGQAIPTEAPVKTLIEVSHRYSTALYGLLVLFQLFSIFKTFPKAHVARFWGLATLGFTVTEALIGRALVTLKLVHESTDLLRLVVMPLHLVNTSLLLLSAVMAAEGVAYGYRERIHLTRRLLMFGGALLAALTVVLTTGAIAALGSHLAPSESLMAGFLEDLNSDSHLAVRLRIIHPVLALLIAMGFFQFGGLSRDSTPSEHTQRWYRWFLKSVVVAMAAGVLTLLTLAPVWLKITHLTLANGLVIVASACLFHTLRPR